MENYPHPSVHFLPMESWTEKNREIYVIFCFSLSVPTFYSSFDENQSSLCWYKNGERDWKSILNLQLFQKFLYKKSYPEIKSALGYLRIVSVSTSDSQKHLWVPNKISGGVRFVTTNMIFNTFGIICYHKFHFQHIWK